jgi:type III secretion protein U
MLPAAIVGTVAEVLQTGPVLSFEKLKPDLSKLNPFEGIKRMFSMDNLVELAKTIAKTALLLFVGWLVIRSALPAILGMLPVAILPTAPGTGRDLALANLLQSRELTTALIGWTLASFLLVAVLDVAWVRHSHEKKLRMSLRDIRDEVKQDEGDPQMKGQRRQLHQEWAAQNNVAAARSAHVMVVNPTHIAIALDYDPSDCPVPVVAARGQGALAQAMREAAEQAGVPIIRNIDVARGLFDRCPVGEIVPEDMFDAIATIIIWARQQRDARPISGTGNSA